MQGTLIKYKNYGTNDPFIARIFFGMLKLRDHIVNGEKERLEFDRLYVPIQENLEEAYESMKKCIDLIKTHRAKVESGEIISFQGVNNEIINVGESVDRELSKNIKDLFIKGEMGIRGIIPLSKHLGFSISFFKKDDRDFEKGCKKFLRKHIGKKSEQLVEMFKESRAWYSGFNSTRSKIEHEGFSLPNAKYVKKSDGKVEVIFPLLNGLQIQQFLERMWDSLFLFTEDLMVSIINLKLMPPLMIRYIPEEFRDKTLPLRYDIWAEGLSEFLEKENNKGGEKNAKTTS